MYVCYNEERTSPGFSNSTSFAASANTWLRSDSFGTAARIPLESSETARSFTRSSKKVASPSLLLAPQVKLAVFIVRLFLFFLNKAHVIYR